MFNPCIITGYKDGALKTVCIVEEYELKTVSKDAMIIRTSIIYKAGELRKSV